MEHKISWVITGMLALPMALAETTRRGTLAYFEQQPIPIIQGLTLTQLAIISVVTYFVYKGVKDGKK